MTNGGPTPVGETPRFLHLSSSLRHALLLYRIRHGVFHKPVLARGDLSRIERKLGTCLPDNVLAMLAATGRRLSDVLRCNEEANRRLDFPPGHAAFAVKDCDEGTTFWCTLVARQPLAKLAVYRWTPGRPDGSWPVTMAGCVTELYDLTPASDEDLSLIRPLSVQFYPRVEGPHVQDSGLWRLRSLLK